MTIVPSVIMRVASVGDAVTTGIAEVLMNGPLRSGEYVLVPRSETAMSPTEAGTEVLKMYGSGVGEMVDSNEFGTVVAIVGDEEAIIDETCDTVSLMVVTLLIGYKPIMGGSLPSIPKLQKRSIVQHELLDFF